MKIQRSANAQWNGTGKEGKGIVSTQSKALSNQAYSYVTRFENAPGTNPEELIGAAHAGCFSMKLAFVLQAAGIEAKSINTQAVVSLENGAISGIELDVEVAADGLNNDAFQVHAKEAKENCPISKLFNCPIEMTAKLV